jgi:hypothetical protein
LLVEPALEVKATLDHDPLARLRAIGRIGEYQGTDPAPIGPDEPLQQKIPHPTIEWQHPSKLQPSP